MISTGYIKYMKVILSHPCLIIVVFCTKLIELVKTLCGLVEILKLKFGRDFEVIFGEVTTAEVC